MSKSIAYLNLIRFFNPIGFWLLLWPGLWGLFLSENMDISYFTIVVLGSFLTRSVGCAINDMIDIQYDKKVDRKYKSSLAYVQLDCSIFRAKDSSCLTDASAIFLTLLFFSS